MRHRCGFYSLYVGGDFEGTRLNSSIADRLDIIGIGDTLDVLFGIFTNERNAGEGFGDFCHRIGLERLRQALVTRSDNVA